jgi:hypothetical protein
MGGGKMKIAGIVSVLALSAVSLAGARDHGDRRISPFKPQITYNDHIAIAVDHGDVLIYDKNNDEEMVEITEDNRLYVRDREVATNAEQQALTREYRDRVIEIKRDVKKIAGEGARIGVDGAKIGLKAVVGVFKLISPDYDSEDLDRDLNRESEKIDAKAEKLEARAHEVDKKVDELEVLHARMRTAIPELEKLEWF